MKKPETFVDAEDTPPQIRGGREVGPRDERTQAQHEFFAKWQPLTHVPPTQEQIWRHHLAALDLEKALNGTDVAEALGAARHFGRSMISPVTKRAQRLFAEVSTLLMIYGMLSIADNEKEGPVVKWRTSTGALVIGQIWHNPRTGVRQASVHIVRLPGDPTWLRMDDGRPFAPVICAALNAMRVINPPDDEAN